MRRHTARVVAAVDALNLENVGAQVGQDHGSRRSGHNRAEIQNAYACKWRGQRVEDSTEATGA
jgi:hypothetical protein